MNVISSATTNSRVISRERHVLLRFGDDCYQIIDRQSSERDIHNNQNQKSYYWSIDPLTNRFLNTGPSLDMTILIFVALVIN